jgi:ribosomal protein S18 acetylase RimI-like enzyme
MALETEQLHLDPDIARAGVLSVFDRPELGFYLVAEQDNHVIGSLMITQEWSDWRNRSFWWIQSVYVLPDFRRRGVYRSMYAHLRELAGRSDQVAGFRLYVERDNGKAQRAYTLLGMKETPYRIFEAVDHGCTIEPTI